MIEFDGFGDVLYVTTQLAIQYIVTSFVTIHLLKLDTHSLSVTSFMGPSQFATFCCLWAPFCSQRSVAYGPYFVHNVQLLTGPHFVHNVPLLSCLWALFCSQRSVAYGPHFVQRSVAYGPYFVHNAHC